VASHPIAKQTFLMLVSLLCLADPAFAVWNPATNANVRVALPAVIEAENFDRYYDATSRNTLGEYRSTGVDIKKASEYCGTYAIGVMQTGEWLEYDVNIPASGAYVFSARVASAETGRSFHLEVNRSDVTGPIVVPYTGPWNTGWATVTKTVTLPAGAHTLRIQVDAQAMDLNYFSLVPTTPVSGPIKVEAEDFSRYYDIGSTNSLGAYRSTGVDIKTSSDSDGAYAVGVMKTGEWLEYDVTLPVTGSYTFSARVASAETGKGFHLESDGVDVTGFMAVPYTGKWNTGWATVSKTVNLVAGARKLRIHVDAQYMDLNYFVLTPLTTTSSAP
jgi:endoglucanase